MRGVLKEIINSHADLEVVGQAPDPISARDMNSFGGVIAWMLAALLALRVRALRLRMR